MLSHSVRGLYASTGCESRESTSWPFACPRDTQAALLPSETAEKPSIMSLTSSSVNFSLLPQSPVHRQEISTQAPPESGPARASLGRAQRPNLSNAARQENPSTRGVRRCVDELDISPGPGASTSDPIHRVRAESSR